MDFIISFFRDVLDGPLYIVVAILCGILICSCIGYLGERYLKKQEAKKLYEETHAAIAEETIDASAIATVEVQQSVGVTSLDQTVVAPMSEVNDTVVNVPGQGQ